MNHLQIVRPRKLARGFAPFFATRSMLALAILLGGSLALPGGATASFTPPIASPGGGDAIAVADINHDGCDDVVVLDGKKVLVNLSDGTGAFPNVATLSGGNGSLFQVAIQDVNNDSHLDVIAWGAKPDGWVNVYWEGGWRSRTYAWYYNVWPGRGDGTFGPLTTTTAHGGYAPPPVSNPIGALGDFNRDGVADAAWVDGINNVVYVTLGSYDVTGTFAAGTSPGSVAVGDFDGDGWTDIVVVNDLSSNSPTLSVLLNDNTW